MADRTRFERSLDRWVARATTPRGAAVVIATVSTTITLGAGTLMTVIDREQFPSIGSGLWWAAQTVTTVGYGDDVPVSFAGRLLAVAVMLIGIGFLTVITAAITSTFVARSSLEAAPSGSDPAAAEQLSHIEKRLARIEAALTRATTAP
jgi:voltage-gated potassium channel